MTAHTISPAPMRTTVPKPSAPMRRGVMLAEVRKHHLASIVEVAATVQFGLGCWALARVGGAAAASAGTAGPEDPPLVTGTAATGPGADRCYRRIAMEVLLALLERRPGTGPHGAEAELRVVVRVVACRRLLLELRRQVSELGLEEAIVIAEVPCSSDGRTEAAVLAGLSAGGGVVDVVTDASKGRGATVGLGWVVATGEGTSYRTGAGTAVCSSVLHAELKAMRKGIQLALSLHPALRGGLGTLRLFSDSRGGLELVRRGLAGALPAGGSGGVRGEVGRICALLSGASAELCWVKGHAGDPLNEVADRLAVVARRSREAGLDAAQAAALRSSIERDAPAAVQQHSRCHFRLAA